MKFYLAIMIAVALSFTACQSQKTTSQNNKQKNEVAEFEVSGLCGMCKNRIEAAAQAGEGVESAAWDKESGTVCIVYNPSKLKEIDLHKRIATAGHDTEKVKAADAVYDALPGCCQHRDANKEKH